MFKRMIQGIGQLFTARQQVNSTSYGRAHSPKPYPAPNSTGRGFPIGGAQPGRPARPFPNPRLRRNGHEQSRPQVGTVCHHNATRLLQDGHLQIGISGFHDTAFNVSVLSRHDAPQLAAAISDLPCRVKMVAERNIADGLLAALHTLDTSDPGRRGIVLVTTGDSSKRETWTRELAEMAARQRIGIHVICLGPKPDDPTCGPRINTKNALGYGGFRIAETQDQLLAAIRDSLDGLTPAFGMRGTNKAVILLDCSETLVESYRNTTRIEMVMAALQEFLKAPLVSSFPIHRTPNNAANHFAGGFRQPVTACARR